MPEPTSGWRNRRRCVTVAGMWFSLLWACRDSDRIGLGLDGVPDNVLAKIVHVRRRNERGGTLRCEGDADADEVHELTLPAPGDGGEDVFLPGLLADTAYACEIVGLDRESELLEFTTDPLPDDLPVAGLVEDGPGGGGYLLLNHGTDDKENRETKFLVYDERGRMRHYYWVPFSAPDLDTQYIGSGQVLYGGGYAALPTIVDLQGRVIAQAPGVFENGNYNHTAERLDDGRVLTTEIARTHDPANPDGVDWMGFTVEFLDPTLQGRAYVLRAQELVDLGQLPLGSASNTDPYHLNALQYFPDEGEVAANLYRLSEVLWIDLDLRSVRDRIGWNTDWRLQDEAGAPLPAADWFYGEHAIEFDGDLLLMHDNGAGRPSAEKYSRAVEYRLDPVARTATLVWEWSEPGWYENIWGDVDRLPDGRVSITHAHCEKCSDVGGQRTEVIVVDRATNEVDWRLRFSNPHDASYRSQWIDGCELFYRPSACE